MHFIQHLLHEGSILSAHNDLDKGNNSISLKWVIGKIKMKNKPHDLNKNKKNKQF